MKPRPVRMPDALWEKLSEEAEESDLGTAEYVRRILRNRQEITLEDTEVNTQPDTQELADRVTELEERVDALESERGEAGSLGVEGGGSVVTSPSAEVSTAGDTDEGISVVVESWSPGRSSEGRDRRRTALRSALEFLSEKGSATRSDFVDELYPATALESHSSRDGWWRGMLLKGLKHAAEEGIVEKDGHSWVWVGE